MGETIWNGFAISGIIMDVLLVYGIIRLLIDEFGDWRKKRKNERKKYCNRCVYGCQAKACITCKRNPNFMDNWREHL